MNPHTLNLDLDRSLPPRATVEHWQATPLRLVGTLDAGADLDWADDLVAELVESQTDNTVLASSAGDPTDGGGDGPYTIEFTAAQMNQSIRDGQKSRLLWLQITAREDGGRSEVLYAAALKLHRTAYSGTVPAPPGVALYAINTFTVLAASGEDDITADGPDSTLTMAAGSGISISNNAGTKTVTLSATNVSAVDNRVLRGDGTTAAQGSGWTINDSDEASVSTGANKTALTITLTAATGTAIKLVTTDETTYPMVFETPNGTTSVIASDSLQGDSFLVLPFETGRLIVDSELAAAEATAKDRVELLCVQNVDLDTELDALINGLTGNGTTEPIFSTLDHSGSGAYVRNASCWAAGVDMTALVVWNSSHAGQLGGIAVTPRHVLFAAHSRPANGASVRFVTASNAVVERTVSTWLDCASADFSLGLLNSDLPATIVPIRILPRKWALNVRNSFAAGLPVFYTDQEKKALVADLTQLSYFGFNITTPADATRASFYETVVSGDSGNPVCFIHNSELVLIGVFTSSTSGDHVGYEYRSEIGAAIDTLGANGHRIQEADWVEDVEAEAEWTAADAPMLTAQTGSRRIKQVTASAARTALGAGSTGGAVFTADDGFIARRALCTCSAGLPVFLSATANITGSGGSAGTTTGNYFPYVYAPAATASKSRAGSSTEVVGSPFGGSGFHFTGTATARFDLSWRFEFVASVCLSAHADSRVSMHLQCTSNPTTLDRPAIEGISLLWRGGASEGTVEIYTHDGTTGSSSSTAAVAIGDQAASRWALEWEPGVAVRLYRNGTLLCTKTTNLPSGASATASSQGLYMLCENTVNGVTHVTALWLYGGNIIYFN